MDQNFFVRATAGQIESDEGHRQRARTIAWLLEAALKGHCPC
jgi:hypothetical protein